MSTKNLTIIGSNALVTIAGIKDVPAKIDTGADSSSIWASDIQVNAKNQLEFCLFGPESSFYTGKRLVFDDYKVQRVRSSTGQVTIRYRVSLPMKAVGKRIKASFTLYDRSSNNFPILIGRKTLKNRFLVDVAHTETERPPKMDNSDLETELQADPKAFHAKYMGKTRYVFWTSGWDSTYMVIKLLRDGCIVQPIYIINPKRKSRSCELAALNMLSRLIAERIPNGKLLPYQTFELSAIKEDPAVAQAFADIMQNLPQGQRPLGYQYRYLASFAKQHPEIPFVGVGLEKALSPDQCACSTIIRQFGKLTPEGHIDASSAPELITLLGRFEFPIINTTEPEMVKNIKTWGYEDIMQHIWFCHRPIKGEQCGFCNPCSSKIIGQMEFLLPEPALDRYQNLKRTEKRYGQFAKKLQGWFYRLRRH